MDRYSTVTIREAKQSKKVKIGSDIKPEIVDPVIQKWQSLLDTLAKVVNVPSGLIMRLNEETIEVFLKSRTKGNPYEVGEKADLIYGLYCETVIGTQKQLIVPDATQSDVWQKDNPDVDINMISYLGVPINWPDGECFGTVCILDNKENHFNKDFENLILQVKQHIEVDLQLLTTNQELEGLNNTKTKFLSLISHDVRGNIGSADGLLRQIIKNLDDFDDLMLHDMLSSLSKSLSSAYITLDNLLSWSKGEIVQIEPEFKEVNIIEVIEELIQYFDQFIKIKSLDVKTDFFSDKAIISADRDMITVSLRNILSNAIKYTPSGGRVTIRVSKPEERYVVEIIDAGVGMDEDTVKNLFSYNKTHSKFGTEGESSSGLGLMLTKEFLDKHHAIVTVESAVDKGTTFKITWP